MPIVAGPSFDPVDARRQLSWVAATDNIQVDHYEILRNGVPVGATDSTSFTDVLAAAARAAELRRARRRHERQRDRLGAAPITTPDWTPPTAPVLTISMSGTTAALRWTPATDNVGVVAYDVLRDGTQIVKTMTAAVRTYGGSERHAGRPRLAGARARRRRPLGHLGGAAARRS